MAIKLTANVNNPPISGLATAHLINEKLPVSIVWGNETSLLFEDQRKLICHSNNDVLRALARAAPSYKLYGETAIERTQIDHWLSFSLTCEEDISWALSFLNKSIAPVTYLVANKLTIADFALFNEMHSRYEVLAAKGIPTHVQRWYDMINAQPLIQKVLQTLPAEAKLTTKRQTRSTTAERESAPKSGERKQEGKFVDLPGAEMGKVVVRFPPEASGYLHIGHAKAALLNQYYAQAFEGKLIMRFDDTNPAKETVEFENVILGDLELLQIKPDEFTHTSNYFDLMLDYCEQLIKQSKAYVDDTAPEQMKAEREQRIESVNRKNSVEKNLSMWQQMLQGSAAGQKCCVRAKIDMASANGCMRDPTIYRCKNEPHPRTGTKYKVYPTYDFACPIVDAIENVTHTLRTMEYHDRDEQFYWFIDALSLRKPYIWEYSRLNMTNTVLSKRKLTWFVESNLVDGWDDPRFPTVRGIIRRGMTVEGLREFIIAQGSSKSVVFMNWDKIWAFNKKVIDPIAPRYTAIDDRARVIVNVAGVDKYERIEVPAHPKNAAVGKKTIALAPQVYIDHVDAVDLKENENATFINWGNLLIKKIHKDDFGLITAIDAVLNLENKDFKKTLKLTWLAVEPEQSAYPPTYCVYFDNIISKPVLAKDEDFKQFIGHQTRKEVRMLGDPELKKCKKGDIIQLQRIGFFKVDVAYAPPNAFTNKSTPIILFSIPDGHTKDMPSSGLKINSAQQSNTNTAAKSLAATDELNQLISQQGEIVRNLKLNKAAKEQIDTEVKKLLNWKSQYKAATGVDWKPAQTAAAKPAVVPTKSNSAAGSDSNSLNVRIQQLGDLIRDLKSKKAAKADIDAQVKILLDLKAQYKAVTGNDWKPAQAAAAAVEVATSKVNSASSNADSLNVRIAKQGDLIRDLKGKKAAKADIDAQVKILLDLKAQYKAVTGKDWKPESILAVTAAKLPGFPLKSASVVGSDPNSLHLRIQELGDLIRDLKSKNTSKTDLEPQIKILLDLKAQYKAITGKDWKPGQAAAPKSTADGLNVRIQKQGDLIRDLKSKKAAKADIDAQVKILLDLKAQYKTATGKDWKPGQATAAQSLPETTNTAEAAIPHLDVLEILVQRQYEFYENVKDKNFPESKLEPQRQSLLDLKTKYKAVTGKDWQPGQEPKDYSLNGRIRNLIRQIRYLKHYKASQAEVCKPVQKLLDLQAQYKAKTGKDWQPEQPGDDADIYADILYERLEQQYQLYKDLKRQKATEADIQAQDKILVDLKAAYKAETGKDWKPGYNAEGLWELEKQLARQGEKIKYLEATKADKSVICAEISKYLKLKADYTDLTGFQYEPVTDDYFLPQDLIKTEKFPPERPSREAIEALQNKVLAQTSKIALMKLEGVDKKEFFAELDLLMALSRDFRILQNQRDIWKPAGPEIDQGEGVIIDLTKEHYTHPDSKLWNFPFESFNMNNTWDRLPLYKSTTGSANMAPSPPTQRDLLTKEINEHGAKVRALKANNACKEDIDEEVRKLLALKARYKEVTGTDFPVAGRSTASAAASGSSAKKSAEKKSKKPEAGKTETVTATGAVKKQTRLGLEATKEDNLPDWYSQVITKGELIEYYDVSGCYILRPWSFAIWKFIRNWFDAEITKMGVKECYFPMFVSKAALEKEKSHIADFSPEVAWVTKSGDSDLAEPIAVRPTSETVMYPAYAKWVQSYRDLPIRLNQWNNVVRWEFKHPQPFLRTREFLWQEGHTAFASKAEADKEVLEILDLYAQIYTDLLAIPVVKGRKTEKEKFAGGDYTTTVEAFISASGRAIQGATSHHLGQNFSKMFEIVFEHPETQQKQYVHQNSWGLTTRTIGVMIMVHADNQGLVLPPHVACVQAIIVPCGITVATKDEERQQLLNACKNLESLLLSKGIRCEGDYRDNYSPGWKFNHWELKGVPVRIEVGPKDLKAKQIVAVRRDTGEKLSLALENVESKIVQLLETIHDSMLAKATNDLLEHTKLIKNWSDFCTLLDQKNILLAPFCGNIACEDQIKKDSTRDEDAEPGAPAMGAKSLCTPFDQPTAITNADKCIHPSCTKPPLAYTLFGRSY